MDALCDDLAAEHADLDAIVAPLDDVAWDLPTPAVGWAVKDQISHLQFFDRTAVLAATDAEAFAASTEELMRSGGVDASVRHGREVPPAQLLADWRAARADLLTVARRMDPKARIPWYGPAMGARSFVTARLMETWAHGQDVADALGASRTPTARLKHIAHIGVTARPWSYAVRGLEVPPAPVSVALTAPDGSTWVWGDETSAERVEGPALDFCLVVTQRRHVDDTALVATGPLADEWLHLAQAFAGGPGAGRSPGQFPAG